MTSFTSATCLINVVWQTATQEIGPLIAALEKLTPLEDREA